MQKQNGIRAMPNLFNESLDFCSCEYQRGSLPVIG
jgi:hypothetical protein